MAAPSLAGVAEFELGSVACSITSIMSKELGTSKGSLKTGEEGRHAMRLGPTSKVPLRCLSSEKILGFSFLRLGRAIAGG